ncbi:MAG TPA: VOC family protein [Lachnospiraceae bacterium]|nr:VOC family protein [Lachnospiraceae bacterium]
MKITHVGIYTSDLERMKVFYEKYFQAVGNEKYENKSGFSSYFMTFESGARLELMSHKDLITREIVDKMKGIAHLAFSVGSREAVDALVKQLTEDGYCLLSPVRETGDGYYEGCIADPDGNRIEITI